MRKRFDLRKKFYVTLGAVLGANLILAGAILAILPAQIEKSSAAYHTTKSELDQFVKRRGQLSELERTLLSKRDSLKILEGVLLERDIEFIHLVEEIARRTSVKATLSPLNASSASGIGGSGYSSALSLEGTYRGVFQFLFLFEHMPFAVGVSSVSIQKTGTLPPQSEGGESESLVRASIAFLVYSL